MSARAPWLEPAPEGVFIRVRVQPRSSKNSVEGVLGDSLKIRLTSPPVEGEANKALVAFLAKLLGVKKRAVTLASGEKSKSKRVRVEGLGAKEAERIINEAL